MKILMFKKQQSKRFFNQWQIKLLMTNQIKLTNPKIHMNFYLNSLRKGHVTSKIKVRKSFQDRQFL